MEKKNFYFNGQEMTSEKKCTDFDERDTEKNM